MTEREQWDFEVTENGQWVAGGSAPDRDSALREAAHYVMMYGQDGGDVQSIVRRAANGESPVPEGKDV